MWIRAHWRVVPVAAILFSGLAAGVSAQGTATPAAPALLPYEPRVDLSTLNGVITVDGSSTVYPITDEAALRFIELAGDVRIAVAFSGTGERNKPHTYRVQGPTFVIEFLNVQEDSMGNVANHIHSVWRRLPADFGL